VQPEFPLPMRTGTQSSNAASNSNRISIFTQKIGSAQKIFIIFAETALSTWAGDKGSADHSFVLRRRGANQLFMVAASQNLNRRARLAM